MDWAFFFHSPRKRCPLVHLSTLSSFPQMNTVDEHSGMRQMKQKNLMAFF